MRNIFLILIATLALVGLPLFDQIARAASASASAMSFAENSSGSVSTSAQADSSSSDTASAQAMASADNGTVSSSSEAPPPSTKPDVAPTDQSRAQVAKSTPDSTATSAETLSLQGISDLTDQIKTNQSKIDALQTELEKSKNAYVKSLNVLLALLLLELLSFFLILYLVIRERRQTTIARLPNF